MQVRDKNGLTESEFLALYKPGDYKRPSVTADIAVIRAGNTKGEYEILLIKRGGHPFLGCCALPGGFAEEGETVRKTAERELLEETHLSGLPLAEIGVFSKPGRDPRGWVMTDAFVTFISAEQSKYAYGDDDASDARWYTIKVSEKDGILSLTLCSGDEKFTAELSVRRTDTPFGTISEFTKIASFGIAFDHAEIIACALNKAGIIK